MNDERIVLCACCEGEGRHDDGQLCRWCEGSGLEVIPTMLIEFDDFEECWGR
jgi:hypothetical protein